MCSEIPRISTRTRFLVLRHASELSRPTNSGRWAALALPSSRLVDYALPGAPADLSGFAEPGTAVLFPSPHPPQLSPPPRQIVVVDATWSQARRMVHRIPALRTLPRLAVPPDAMARRAAPMRAALVPGGLSTLEAMAGALFILGEREAAHALQDLHVAAMERAWRLRRGTTLPALPLQ